VHLGDLRVRRGGDAVGGIEDQIVANDRIGDDLNGFAAVQHRVAFDDVEPVAAPVHEDARVLHAAGRVVDHVVAYGVAIGAHLDLDPVIATVAGRPRAVDVVPLDVVVGRDARGIVAADVHALTLGGPDRRCQKTGVMDVISPDDERVGVATVHAEGIVSGLVDLVPLEDDVMPSDEAHPAVSALEVQALDD